MRSLKKMSEDELIVAYKESENMEYVGELFQRKTHLIASLSLKFLKNETDAEDATYEVFEILSKDLLRHEVSNINSWLFSVTRNHCYKKLRKTINEREKINEEKNSSISFMQNVSDDDLLEKELLEEQLDLMEEMIELLSEEQRICLKLFYLEKKSYVEIVEETKYELKKVKSYIQNGRRNVKILMDKRIADNNE
jgi:RNA polymerase sigma-70 factor (ECF subfamily)